MRPAPGEATVRVRMRTYHHVGLPTNETRPGMTRLEHLGVCCTDDTASEFGVQWMQYLPGCALPDNSATRS